MNRTILRATLLQRYRWSILAFAIVGLSVMAAPAWATDQAEAIKLCAKNPNCGIFRYKGGVDLYIEGKGKNQEIHCPDNGPCVCLTCRQAGSGPVSVVTVLRSGAKAQDGPPQSIIDGAPSGPPPAPAPVPPAESPGQIN